MNWWNVKYGGYWNFVVVHFCLLFFCDWDDCNKTGKVSFSVSVVTCGVLVWVQWKKKNLMRVVDSREWWDHLYMWRLATLGKHPPPIKVGQHPRDNWITYTRCFSKRHHENKNDINDNNNNNNNISSNNNYDYDNDINNSNICREFYFY